MLLTILGAGFIAGLSAGLSAALSAGLGPGLSDLLIIGLLFAVFGGVLGGLGAAAQHGVLRLLLWRYRIAPLRYVRWLNYTVRLRLLYRSTSGGYMFIRRILQDYFGDAVADRPG